MTTANSPAVDKSGERIQRMFGEISGRYDFLNHFLSGGTDIYWRWRTVRRVSPQGELPILDVCCGTGDLSIAYWKKARRQVPVFGTDFTPEMIDLAQIKAARFGSAADPEAPSGLRFSVADTLQLPFEDNLFQIVSVAFGIRNVSDTVGGLREMTRVCAPGGRVAVLEFSMPRNRVFGALYRWYFRNVLPRIGQFIARNKEAAYNYLPQSVAAFPQDDEFTGMMQQAGLIEATFTPLTFGIATLYVGTKPAQAG